MLRGPQGRVGHEKCAVLGRWPVRGWLLVLVALALAACGQGDDGSAHAEKTTPPPAVTVAQPLVQQLTEYDEFTGRFEPFKRVEVRARVSGYLQSINFADGQIVEAGQLLFVVDPKPYQIAVEQAQAAIDGAKARAQLAELQLNRASTLVNTSALSRATLDQRLAEKRQADADLAAAVAHLDQAKLDLGYTEVRAPSKGASPTVASMSAISSPATRAPRSLPPLWGLDPIYFVFDMSETRLPRLSARGAGTASLPSTRDHRTPISGPVSPTRRTGRIRGPWISSTTEVDQGTGTLRARAVVANPNYFITPGQFGRLRLPGSPLYPAILIPESAILTDQSRKVVMTVGPDGVVAPRVIRPGPHELGLRIVRSGLQPGDQIVIDGLTRARPGAKVTAEPGKIVPVAQPDAG